jgi:hypothetical protein
MSGEVHVKRLRYPTLKHILITCGSIELKFSYYLICVSVKIFLLPLAYVIKEIKLERISFCQPQKLTIKGRKVRIIAHSKTPGDVFSAYTSFCQPVKEVRQENADLRDRNMLCQCLPTT